MSRDPILAVRELPPGDGYKCFRTFRVMGGLHYLKGNSSPYFSLTYWAHRKGFPGQCESGGAGHDEILRYYPKFSDLAALHLCGIDGAPMYAVENGWYDLAGALGGAGERFHAGNSKRNFSREGWQITEYREPTPDECLQMFADHCRCTLEEAARIRDRVQRAIFVAVPTPADQKAAALAVLREEMDAMRPRWKAEAEACIAKHNLRVYGDAWEG